MKHSTLYNERSGTGVCVTVREILGSGEDKENYGVVVSCSEWGGLKLPNLLGYPIVNRGPDEVCSERKFP